MCILDNIFGIIAPCYWIGMPTSEVGELRRNVVTDHKPDRPYTIIMPESDAAKHILEGEIAKPVVGGDIAQDAAKQAKERSKRKTGFTPQTGTTAVTAEAVEEEQPKYPPGARLPQPGPAVRTSKFPWGIVVVAIAGLILAGLVLASWGNIQMSITRALAPKPTTIPFGVQIMGFDGVAFPEKYQGQLTINGAKYELKWLPAGMSGQKEGGSLVVAAIDTKLVVDGQVLGTVVPSGTYSRLVIEPGADYSLSIAPDGGKFATFYFGGTKEFTVRPYIEGDTLLFDFTYHGKTETGLVPGTDAGNISFANVPGAVTTSMENGNLVLHFPPATPVGAP